MRSSALARFIQIGLGGLFAVLMLQGCGLKGDLYLEDGTVSSGNIQEQEEEEFLEESLDEQTEDVESMEDPSFEDESTEILEGQ